MSKTFIKNTETNIEGIKIASDGTITLPPNITIDGVDLGVFKTDYDGKVNQDVRSTASPTFAAITVPTITPAGVGLSVSTTGSTFGGNKYTLLLKDTNPLAANNGSGIIFGAIATGSTVSPDLGSIRINKDNSTDGHYGYSLQFYNSTSSGTLTKHMEISSSGAVTLGPDTGNVSHTSQGRLTFNNSKDLNGSYDCTIISNNAYNDFTVANGATVNVKFGAPNATALVLLNDASGNSALIYAPYVATPSIITSYGNKFVTGTPSTTQIQITKDDSTGSLGFTAGATGGTQIWAMFLTTYGG